MGNIIESQSVLNPSGIQDIVSHLVIDAPSTLVISDCIPYIGNYSFQMYIRGSQESTVVFHCWSTIDNINVTTNWEKYTKQFTIEVISNIELTFGVGEYWIYNTKLEIGDYNTDWSPHPDDDLITSEGDLVESFRDLKTIVLTYAQETSDVRLDVNRANQSITEAVSKTTRLSNLVGKLQDSSMAMNKWLLVTYDKSKFSDSILDDSIDDRERYDMQLLSGVNADVVPDNETLIDDTASAMTVDAKGKILYYFAFIKFDEPTDVTCNCTHGKGTLYLNGVPKLFSPNSVQELETIPVILDFVQGENVIEIVTNESSFSLDTSISLHEKCSYFNGMEMAVTSRSMKSISQAASEKITLNQILNEVFEIVTENVDGVEHRYIKQSLIKQSNDRIEMLATFSDDDESSTSTFSITPNAINSITEQFVVKDPVTGDSVVIEKGILKANSIITEMIDTNAIKSSNFDLALEDIMFLLQRDEEGNIVYNSDGSPKKKVISYVDENGNQAVRDAVAQDNLPGQGTFLDLANGNIYSPSFVLNNELGEAYIKGNIYADTGKIGCWNIQSDAIWKGSNELGADGSNIYFGESGFSLGDTFIYDSENNSLRLTVNSLNILNTGENWDKYYVNNTNAEAPSLSDYPSSEWDPDTYSNHVGCLCYNSYTGKTYSFEQLSDSRFKITFHPTTNIKASDYIQIYYAYNRQIYCINKYITGNNIEDIIIASDTFFVYWHANAYTSTTDGYNFSISASATISNTELTNAYVSTLPRFNADYTLDVGEFPSVDSDSYPTVETDKLWYVKIANNGYGYGWIDVTNSNLNKEYSRITNMHYDSTNGLIMYYETKNKINLPDRNLTQTELNSYLEDTYNSRLDATGLSFYSGNDLIVSYGDTIKFFAKTNSDNTAIRELVAEIGENGLKYLKGTITLGTNFSSGFISRILSTDFTYEDIETYSVNGFYADYNNSLFVGSKDNYLLYYDDILKIKGEINATSGKIGGINIDNNNLYTGNKTTIDSTEPGFILGVSGDNTYLNIGNSSSYLKWDGSRLIMNVSSLLVGGEEFEGEDYSWAAKTATNFLYYNSTDGLVIHSMNGEISNVNYIRDGNVRINTSGMHIYYGQTKLVSYGETTNFYAGDGYTIAATLGNEGLKIINGIISLGNFVNENSPLSNQTDHGLHINSDGDFFLGDYNNYIKWYLGELSISVKSLSISGTNIEDLADGSKTATNYLYYDSSNGLVVHNNNGEITSVTSLSEGNIRLTTQGLDIYYGQTILASYGETTNFYAGDGYTVAATLGSEGFKIINGIISLGKFKNELQPLHDENDHGLYVNSEGNFFLGDHDNYVKWDSGKLSISVQSLSISGTSIEEIPDGSKTATNYLYYDLKSGLVVHNNNGEIDDVTSLKDSNIRLTTHGLDIYYGQTILASYGATTNFYAGDGETIAATLGSEGLSIVKGDITLGQYFSVNSDGVISAKSGNIGNLTISTDGTVFAKFQTTFTSEAAEEEGQEGSGYEVEEIVSESSFTVKKEGVTIGSLSEGMFGGGISFSFKEGHLNIGSYSNPTNFIVYSNDGSLEISTASGSNIMSIQDDLVSFFDGVFIIKRDGTTEGVTTGIPNGDLIDW